MKARYPADRREGVGVAEQSHAAYGFDAPAVPVGLAAAAVVLLGLTVVVAVGTAGWWWLIPLAYGLFFLLSCASFVYTTRRGKFVVWAGLLSELHLTGRERVVDLGCGRGAVLIMLARLVPRGRAVGVDLWRSLDQSGNDPAGVSGTAGRGDAPARSPRPGDRGHLQPHAGSSHRRRRNRRSQ